MKTILLLDDEEPTLDAHARMLRRLLPPPDWRIVTRSRSFPTIADINKAPDPFDVVISDFMMPGASGDEVVAAARRRDQDTFCILFSGTVGEAEVANQTLPADRRAHHVVLKGTSDSLTRLAELIRAHFPASDPPPAST